ncbi:MAG: YrhK family protein [Pseudomonadota bacterium]
MTIFDPNTHARDPRTRRIYAITEILRTAVDFAAAVFFLVGSILFFDEDTQYAATWLFVVGSVLFAVRPTIKLARELLYLRRGDYKDITRS